MVVQMYIIYLWSHQTKVRTTVKQVEIGEKTVIQIDVELSGLVTISIGLVQAKQLHAVVSSLWSFV
jgi:hypothetical protein